MLKDPSLKTELFENPSKVFAFEKSEYRIQESE